MIAPSIGRKVWVWSTTHSYADQRQAFDATVIFVHSEDRITVRFDNHWGTQQIQSAVLLRDPLDSDMHSAVEEALVATWMPYQVKTAAKESQG